MNDSASRFSRPPAPSPLDVRSLDFFKQLTQLPYIEAIYLYGSRSRGDYTEMSDVDIAISCPQATDEQWQNIEQIVNSTKLLLKLDVKRLDKMHPSYPFYQIVHDTKSLLFYRHGKARLSVLKSALDAYEHSLASLESSLPALSTLSDREQEAWLTSFANKLDQLLRTKLRMALLVNGIRQNAPLAILRYAVHVGWITNRPLWEELYEVWEYTREPCAPQVRSDILTRMPTYVPALRELYETLKDVHNEAREFYDNNHNS